jgi:hypothetical protein
MIDHLVQHQVLEIRTLASIYQIQLVLGSLVRVSRGLWAIIWL